ncbi:MAG TPA: DUF481 domain-containing protein [Polyangia bacterium]|jgi:hypothetical protein|nr:DUF481 domain-containing protein [Polyangia bacterium]
MKLVPPVLLALAGLSTLASLAGTAAAQTEPKFEFGKQADTKKVQWKLSTQAGLIYSTGNSRNVSVSGGVDLSRDDGKNRFTFTGNGAYVRTTQRVANDIDGNGAIGPGEIADRQVTTTALWSVKGRYDRFFTPRNSFYLTGGVLGNRPAGKVIVAAGQVGYSRLIYQGKRNELSGEGGYDFTFERDIGNVPDLFIHSLRLYLGYGLKISETTAFSASVEALLNLNPENGPLGRIAPIQDTRINGRAAITTKLWKLLSLRVSFTARYDNSPAPLPALSIPYQTGFIPLASRLDTITEVAIVAQIL